MADLIKQIKIGNTTYDIGTGLDNVTGVLPIANGGTGASTAAAALTNLGVAAAGSNLGLVKTGGDVTISNGVITVKDDSHAHVIGNIDGLQDALNAANTYTDTKVAALVNSAPETLDTLGEVADALEENASVVEALNSAIGTKAPTSHASTATTYGKGTSNDYGHVKLSDAIDSTSAASSGIAASPKAVKTAYDLANGSISNLSISGKTITYTKNDGTTDTLTTQDTNTDTKVTQTVTTSNASYPILLAPSGQTATKTTTTYFDSGVTLNPSTNTIAANISGNAGSATKLATTRTISLTGDVTGSASFNGSANASITATVADDSHAHSNYAPYEEKTATTAETAGWYRIATTAQGISNCQAIFYIVGKVSGNHTTATIAAGTSYGVTASSNISVLQCSQYSGEAISKVRIVYHTSYANNYAYLEVYTPNAKALPITVRKISGEGWTLVAPNTAGSVPSGYSSKEVDLENGTMYSEKYVGSGASLTSLNASNISSGTIAAARLPDASTSAKGAMTTTMVTKLNGIATGAEVNQNAFSNVTVGSTTIAADSKTDTLTLVAGSNVTLTPDATNDKITIAAKDTTYSAATSNAAGLMSAADKAKLDGIASGATANTGDITGVTAGSGLTGGGSSGSVTLNVGAGNGITVADDTVSVSYSTTAPVVAGTASVGTATTVSRSDHVHPAQTTVSGNAGSATKLATTRYIDGVSFNGSANVTRYATCSTAAETVAKTASITAGTFSLITGARVTVKFTYANTVASPTLNVGSTGAKAIYWHGAALASSQYWQAGAVLDFVYNGTQWELVGIAKDNNTTYSLSSFSVTATAAELNKLDGVTATTAELNILDGLTATTTELNYVDGVTSNIQTQLGGKAPTSHASTATTYGVSTASNYGHAMASSTTPKANGTAAVGSETAKFARGDHIHPAQTTISGNAGTATTLKNTRYIDGIAFNGAANVTRYTTCSTAAATAAKTCSVTAGTFNLITGARVLIKFTVTNTASSPTLNVNSTGAKAIMYRGAAISKGYLAANRIYEFVYDGTDWELIGDIDTNTTYNLSSFVTISETEPSSTTKLWLKPKV